MGQRAGEGVSPDRFFDSVKITLEHPAEITVSRDGAAHVIALNEWQKHSVMRVVPRVKYSLVPFRTGLNFFITNSGGEESGLQQNVEFAGNRVSHAGQPAQARTGFFEILGRK